MTTTDAPLDTATVVAAAGDLIDATFADDGIDALTLTRVANELGVTQPALYRHVDGMSDLWRQLGLTTREVLAAELAEACIGLSGVDAVRALADAWREFAKRHPGRYRSTERFPVEGDLELEQAVARTLDVVTMSLRGFGLEGDELVHCARTVRSALHGFCSYELGDGHPDRGSIDESFASLVDILCVAFEATVERHAMKADR